MKFHRSLAALALVAAALIPGITLRGSPPVALDSPPAGVTIAGVDAHDGTVYKDGTTYYLIGTRYSCSAGNFNWGIVPTTFCGFSVFTAPALTGPWTFVRTLFPVSDTSSYDGSSWQHVCGDEGSGCFNPRMLKRGDGVWILWFNGPYDEVHYGANGYYAMGCNGPAGPCGASAGAPNGSTHKPSVWKCNNSGDFSLTQDGANAWIVCNTNTYSLATEKLDTFWVNGTNVGVRGVAGLTNMEGSGAYKDADGTWVVTFSDPACGYCAGTGTGYAIAPALSGPWTFPGNASASAGDPAARRKISANSCGGQPRTITTIDGVVYQFIDTWYGARNETNANIRLAPLVRTGQPYIPAIDGTPLKSPFLDLSCS